MTPLYVYLSVCERFGMDPTTFAAQLDPWWWAHLATYDAVQAKLGK